MAITATQETTTAREYILTTIRAPLLPAVSLRQTTLLITARSRRQELLSLRRQATDHPKATILRKPLERSTPLQHLQVTAAIAVRHQLRMIPGHRLMTLDHPPHRRTARPPLHPPTAALLPHPLRQSERAAFLNERR